MTDATAARNKAEAETSKARAVLGFLQDMMSAADPNRDGKDVKIAELLERASAALPNTETLKDKPLIEAAVRQAMAETYHGLGMPDRAVEEFKRAIELQEANEETVSKDRIINMHALGTSLLTLGRLDEAQRIVEEAMSLLGVTKSAEISDEPTAELLGLYNLILGSRGQFQDMIPNARRRLAFYDRTYGRADWRTVRDERPLRRAGS
ncbi:MAG: tetratricopeptide repeat protein [Planctomycetes bacterium]|nr:tetratricopeptide repeat protein [Planctomycetota bacterium]